MGRYQAYPAYRASEVKWLDILPANWQIKKIKTLCKLSRELVGKKAAEYQLLSLTLRGVIHRDISDGSGKIPAEFDTYQVVKPKDLIFCLFDIDETPRTIGLSSDFGMITGAYNVYSCLPASVPEYLYYYFMHIDSFKGLRPFYTGLRKVVRAETFANIEVPVPSIPEQMAIANFLDQETAKIDMLIEKQQQLIQLLKEKRQAVISHAVTKGLNPDVPMKDSGVEWLGEVPEHWEVCAIGYVSNGVFTGGTPKNESSYSDIESDLNWFGPSDFRDTRLLSESNKYLTLESHKLGDSKLFFRDSVLVIGIGATLGKVGYCNKEFSCNQQINVIYPNQRVSYKYLAIALSMQEAQMKISSNASTIGIMNQEKTKSILIAVPPREEQEQIVLSVELIESKYAKLIELAGNQVELLQERRTALISAAVTGKIDVRNFSAQLT